MNKQQLAQKERRQEWREVMKLIEKLNDKTRFLKSNPELIRLVEEYSRLDCEFSKRVPGKKLP